MYKVIEEKLINYGTVSGQRTAFVLAHIVCDTASDIPEPLPHWVAGSRCDVLENNGTVYLLSNARQWEQVNFYNQGEGGEFDPDNYYTKDETDYEITEKVAEIVADAPEDFNTLKEMSDWIAGHEDSAAAMNSQIQANTLAIAGKVDKVTGKGLSTEDYTSAEKTKLAGLSNYDDTALQTAVANKVDKVSGKGLSTEDYTTAEKTKLSGIEAGANNITVDSALSSSSTNPVQNKVINSEINNINSALSRKVVRAGDTGLSGTFEPQQNYGANLGSTNYRFDKIYGKDLYLTNSLIYVGDSAAGVNITNLVEKEQGKGLSTEDYTTAEKTKLAGLSNYDDTALQTAVANKVDKVSGKGLSTEDYTTNEKTKLAGLTDTGAKNLLSIEDKTLDYQGIHYVIQNGIVRATGTATASPSREGPAVVRLPPGSYVMAGCPSGGSDTTYRLDLFASATDSNYSLYDSVIDRGNGVTFTLNSEMYVRPTIRFQNGYSPDGLEFKLMVCTANDYAVSPAFVPYAPTNRELYEMILALQNGG